MSLATELEKWMSDRKDAIVNNYNASGMRASGSFERALTYKVTENQNSVNAVMTGAGHSYFMEHGRKPTSPTAPYMQGKPLKEMIRQWIDDKGINPTDISKDSLAFLIARKIHREGWKTKHPYPDGIISSEINEASIKKLLLSLGNQYVSNVKSSLLNEFNDSPR